MKIKVTCQQEVFQQGTLRHCLDTRTPQGRFPEKLNQIKK